MMTMGKMRGASRWLRLAGILVVFHLMCGMAWAKKASISRDISDAVSEAGKAAADDDGQRMYKALSSCQKLYKTHESSRLLLPIAQLQARLGQFKESEKTLTELRQYPKLDRTLPEERKLQEDLVQAQAAIASAEKALKSGQEQWSASGALKKCEETYKITRISELLWSIARLRQKLGFPGDCARDKETFRKKVPEDLWPKGRSEEEKVLCTQPPLLGQIKEVEFDPSMRWSPPPKRWPPPPPPKRWRPLWQRLIGGAAIVGGGVMVGIGAWAISRDGQCADTPVAPVPVCPHVYDSRGLGGGLVGVGVALVAGGAIFIAVPRRK